MAGRGLRTGRKTSSPATSPEALGEVRWHMRVRCAPHAGHDVAKALARREDTVWVALSSGGTEINCSTGVRPGQVDRSVLLQRLPRIPSVVDVTAHCVMHTFFGGPQSLVMKSGALTPNQAEQLTDHPLAVPDDRPPLDFDDADRRLLQSLAIDGRTALTDLATLTGWSPAKVRRRMDELQTHGTLYFDLELDWHSLDVRVRFRM
ncbi:AsnC family protein [Streptomyces sp. NPDC002012]|uniref:AsnC family protein n=1 Tax=Streptomyces sp. NPDC002012 TaxID=3154532 RepID=UPI0033198797